MKKWEDDKLLLRFHFEKYCSLTTESTAVQQMVVINTLGGQNKKKLTLKKKALISLIGNQLD